MMKEATSSIRLDKWLWAARFYKTRSLARTMIEGGKVHYNGQRTKPSKLIEEGAVVRLRQGHDEKEVLILKLSEHRGKAEQALLLYQETPDSLKKREQNTQARKLNSQFAPSPQRKPDKKERRSLLKIKHGQE